MKDLLKNKSVVIALTVSLLILVLIIILSPKKSTQQLSGKSPISSPSTELINLSKERRDSAMIYTAEIEKKLPLSVETFPTSVGIITSIYIYRSDNDPAELVRLEISGLSYLNKNELDEKKNPNVTAFKESFLKAVELLEGQNIDPKKLIFIYGDKDYVRETSSTWVEKLKLLP